MPDNTVDKRPAILGLETKTKTGWKYTWVEVSGDGFDAYPLVEVLYRLLTYFTTLEHAKDIMAFGDIFDFPQYHHSRKHLKKFKRAPARTFHFNKAAAIKTVNEEACNGILGSMGSWNALTVARRGWVESMGAHMHPPRTVCLFTQKEGVWITPKAMEGETSVYVTCWTPAFEYLLECCRSIESQRTEQAVAEDLIKMFPLLQLKQQPC